MMNSRTADSGVASATVANDSIRHGIQQSGPLYRKRSQGSLPLKKRRLLSEVGLGKNDYDRESVTSSTASSSCEQTPSIAIPAGSDEKIAALALVAAATAALEPALTTSFTPPQFFTSKNFVDEPSYCSKITQCQESSSASQHPPFILQHVEQQKTQSQTKSRSQSQTQEQAQEQAHSVNLKAHPQFSDESSKTSRQRVHHPPLSQPLPNGCHGRTSRNNSYCRRHPCYNGSKYCKLHYQQYVIAGTRAPSDNTGSDASADNDPLATVSKSPAGGQTGVSSSTHQHQDKRFTGFGDECRCQATTTRGRPCAYVSVNKTKYCHLHVDYDVNPPPRRGGISSSTGSPNIQKKIRHKLPIDEEQSVTSISRDATTDASSPDSGAVATTKPTSIGAPLSVVSEESVSAPVVGPLKSVLPIPGTNVTDTSRNEIALNSIFSSYPLLSSISSDQWSNKLVVVSTGPLVNRTGRVVKWGNGWVTVRISTGSTTHEGAAGLLHNRRSIELFLLPDQKDQEIGEEIPKPEEKHEEQQKTAPVAVSSGTSQPHDPTVDSGSSSQSHELRRCVSRDNDSPDPSCVEDGPSNTASNGYASKISKGDDSKEPRKDLKQEPSMLREKLPQSEAPAVASPVPGCNAVEHLSVAPKTEAKSDTEPSLQIPPNTPRPVPAVCEGATTVTPKPPSPGTLAQPTQDGKGIPLLQELLVAQTGGNGRKYNLDLVFNTPSRVTRKPTLYQDTAMLEKKRSGSSSSESEAKTGIAQKQMQTDPHSP